jgi:cation:H+ antiporter
VTSIDFRGFSVPVNLAIFGVAALAVWIAGTRLARYGDAIGDRTRLSKAFLGMILLGVATSLPEIATTVTGSLLGNASLVAGNLFGGVALQIAVLAVADLAVVRGALTYFTPQPVLLFQGVMLMLLLALATAGAAAGEPVTLAGVGLTPVILMAGYVLTVRFARPGPHLPPWRATNEPPQTERSLHENERMQEVSNARIYIYSGLSAVAILLAGWALARTGDALAAQTALGASFVGVALVAASTSLPELSTTLAAVRLGNYEMAVSNILGTNCLEVALFLVADAVYRGGPILAATDRSALFASTVGMVVTCIYLLGLLERRNRTILRMGVDSAAVLVTYTAGLVGLYFLR